MLERRHPRPRFTATLTLALLLAVGLTGCANGWVMGVDGDGYRVQCADGAWSNSGGKQGACSHHGGEGYSGGGGVGTGSGGTGGESEGTPEPFTYTPPPVIHTPLPGWSDYDGIYQWEWSPTCAPRLIGGHCFRIVAGAYELGDCANVGATIDLLDAGGAVIRRLSIAGDHQPVLQGIQFDFADQGVATARFVSIGCAG